MEICSVYLLKLVSFICYSLNIHFVFYDELHNLLDKFYNLGGQPPATGGSGMDKGKEWQMELLMEKLRSKASTFKPLVETAKNLRMAMLVSDLQYFDKLYLGEHQYFLLFLIG